MINLTGMADIKTDLKELGFRGRLADDAATRDFYSHDASMFELVPETVVFPTDVKDIQRVVSYVAKRRKAGDQVSVTARSAGTDMSGGAINESIIVSMTEHFNKIEHVDETSAHVQPGVYYRDFETETLKYGSLLPSYPASRDLCTVGGMVANNAGGEKSLQFGKTEKYVTELEVVLADGKKYIVKPLHGDALKRKLTQKDFEGRIYKNIFELCDDHYDEIKAAKPHVSKDSTGYHLWNVWDRETGVFDLTQVIVGSQGTLGLVTDIKFRLVPAPKHSGLLVLFLKNSKKLGAIIPTVLKHNPATFESFDDATLWLSIRFMPSFLKMLGPKRFINLLINLIPDGLQLLRGIPKLILMVEFNGETEEEVRSKIRALHQDLKRYRARYEINGFEETATEGRSEKFWIMRRNSFKLLREKVKDKHTAPYIDDFVVPPEHLTKFLPQLQRIIRKYKLLATVAGHMGDGNFHVIPLMKIEDPNERRKIEPSQKEVNNLVLKYGGSLSGEHNDGLVRGPWLRQMYSPRIMQMFKDVKHAFDPDNIFNPHKKVDADWEYTMSHIREHF